MPHFPTFKKIALGGPKPKLKDAQISPYAEEMLKQVTYQKRKEYADLAVVKVADMGLPDTRPTTSQIYDWAEGNGLDLCPAEVGPRLREAYRDQPKGEWLVIAMQPLLASDGRPYVFCVCRDDEEAWLGSSWAGPDRPWDSDYRFVFRKSSVLKSSALRSELPDEYVFAAEEYKKGEAAGRKAAVEYLKAVGVPAVSTSEVGEDIPYRKVAEGNFDLALQASNK